MRLAALAFVLISGIVPATAAPRFTSDTKFGAWTLRVFTNPIDDSKRVSLVNEAVDYTGSEPPTFVIDCAFREPRIQIVVPGLDKDGDQLPTRVRLDAFPANNLQMTYGPRNTVLGLRRVIEPRSRDQFEAIFKELPKYSFIAIEYGRSDGSGFLKFDIREAVKALDAFKAYCRF